jgi:hypothetical protein
MQRHQESLYCGRSRGLYKTMALLVGLTVCLMYLPGRAQEEEELEFKGVGIHLRLYGAGPISG